MKIGQNAWHTFLITKIILIFNAWCSNLRNLGKCGRNLGVLQSKKLTSDLKESETCHISQMNPFFMLIAWFDGLLAALGGTRVISIQNCKICPQKLPILTEKVKGNIGGALVCMKTFCLQFLTNFYGFTNEKKSFYQITKVDSQSQYILNIFAIVRLSG